jgi:hypothetical protein
MKNNVRGTTVGPTAIRRPVVPGEVLKDLITLVQESRHQNWIQDQHAADRLREKLLQAKRRLEKGNRQGARETLDDFIDDTQAISCKDVDCPPRPSRVRRMPCCSITRDFWRGIFGASRSSYIAPGQRPPVAR